MSGPRRTADRLRRLLVILPWLMEHGDTPLADLAERFDISEANLIKDLEMASMCGLPPYLDEMVDVYIDDDMACVGVPRLFDRPLRLTADEGVALLAAVKAALVLPGADQEGALARAVAKLAAAVGDPGELEIDVERPVVLDVVRAAAEGGEKLDITYWSAASDEVTRRRIAPLSVLLERGRWYVAADDERTGEGRLFRIDRIEDAAATGEHFERHAVPTAVASWLSSGDATEVTLRLPESGRWVAETYPVAEVRDLSGGGLEVRLAVLSQRWLERVLLRVGPDAAVIEPQSMCSVGCEAAERLLARYG
jgi:proteasome accessory factor C